MAHSLLRARQGRYVVPLGVAAVTAAVVLVPRLASGETSPGLPARTAGQLLSALERATVPNFSGTVVETARLGLPSLSDSSLAGIAAPGQGLIGDITTLLAGSHTLQVAYGGPERQRIAIFLDNLSETDIVHNGADLWTYSSADNSVSHTVNKQAASEAHGGNDTLPAIGHVADPGQLAQDALAQIDPSTAVTVDRTAHVAGRAAYQLNLSPRASSSLIGSVRIAIDAATSLPLRVQVWPRTSTSSPALQVAFTSLHLATPAASTFDFTTPPGATVKPHPFSAPELRHLGKRHIVKGGRQVGGTLVRPAPTATAPTKTSGEQSGNDVHLQVVGDGWLRIIVGDQAAAFNPAQGSPPSTTQQLTAALHQLTTPVAAGDLLRTSLVSVLLTKDGRILVGAVTPSYLEQVAAQGPAK
jgi:outer membrane lipoprotein-sorting protein